MKLNHPAVGILLSEIHVERVFTLWCLLHQYSVIKIIIVEHWIYLTAALYYWWVLLSLNYITAYEAGDSKVTLRAKMRRSWRHDEVWVLIITARMLSLSIDLPPFNPPPLSCCCCCCWRWWWWCGWTAHSIIFCSVWRQFADDKGGNASTLC